MAENAASLPVVAERRYERPPLIEALCEVYFAGSRWDATVPGQFYERVRHEYPLESQVDQFGIEFQISPGQAETRPLPVEARICFTREDNTRLLQLARDLLVVNQLRPYPHYEEWCEVVHVAVALYRELTAPTGINRIGVRYINRVTIPGDGIRMEDYFRVYPEIPEELGGSHGAFMLQLLMPPVCPGHQLTLSVGLIPPERPNATTVLMDLYDVVPLGGRDRAGDLRRLMDEAHTNIVHTFENALTDASRRLFGEITHV